MAALVLLSAGLVGSSGAIGRAQEMAPGAYQHASFTLTETRPGQVTGERFLIDYVNPADPGGKPVPVRRLSATLPPGARIDTAVPQPCQASDAELSLLGSNACPAASRIGRGTGTVDTGFAEPTRFVTARIDVFNRPGGFVAVSTTEDPPAAAVFPIHIVFRFTISGRTWTVQNPPLPGTPPDGGALKSIDVSIYAIRRESEGAARNYITTPPRCPSRGYWTTTLQFSYDAGVQQTVSTHTPCQQR